MDLRAAVLGLILPATALAGEIETAGDLGTPPSYAVEKLPRGAVVRAPGQEDQRHPVEVRLLVKQAVVAPGDTVDLGVHLVQDDHWHTYWKNPGEIGLPTDITWSLPDGAVAGERIWPVPVRFEQEGIVSFGYDGQVLHQVPIALPDDIAAGEHRVDAKVSWLVCKTQCIPGEADVSTTIVVGDTTVDGPEAPLFDHFEGLHPVATAPGLRVEVIPCSSPVVANSPLSYVVSVRSSDGTSLGAKDGVPWPHFTPVEPDLAEDWMLDATTFVARDDGFDVKLEGTAFDPDPLPTDDVIGGLVQVELPGGWVRTEVVAPLGWAAAGTPTTAHADPRCDVGQAVAEAPVEEPEVEPIDPDCANPLPNGECGDEIGGDDPVWDLWVLLGNLGMAFLGGLILNVMPCVLPVLTLKLYSLVEQVDLSNGEKRSAGLLYTAGILVSFWVLALGVWVARTAVGGTIGWGFQFQYPGYVAGLATVVFLFGLSLFGVFEIPAFGTGNAHELSSKEGPAGYFFTGVFATLVATPCSAPFLGTAIAFAFQAPTAVLVLVFTAVGLGLASPFLLVAFVPGVYRYLPQPGDWMEHFKQVLGFTLIATTVWLTGVLAAQIGPDRITGFLAFLTAVGFAAWVYGTFGGVAESAGKQLRALGVGLIVVLLVGWRFLDMTFATEAACYDEPVDPEGLAFDEGVPWQGFSERRVEDLHGHTLFIDFTAEWCVSCKVNEKTVLETAAVREAFAKHGVIPLKADWTRKDEIIGAWLKRWGRAGVPMYLVVPPSGVGDAILLPEVITPGMVIEAVETASR